MIIWHDYFIFIDYLIKFYVKCLYEDDLLFYNVMINNSNNKNKNKIIKT